MKTIFYTLTCSLLDDCIIVLLTGDHGILALFTLHAFCNKCTKKPSCFVQNEDVLKKCAQEYLSRVRKEEQRYQALKIHAEEKLDK